MVVGPVYEQLLLFSFVFNSRCLTRVKRSLNLNALFPGHARETVFLIYRIPRDDYTNTHINIHKHVSHNN